MNAVSGSRSGSKSFIRLFALFLVTTLFLFLASRYLMYWQDWPSVTSVIQWLTGAETELLDTQHTTGILMLALYVVSFVFVVVLVKRSPTTPLSYDAIKFKNWAYFTVRAAFWAVFLIGLVDATISLLRVENFLIPLVGQEIADALGLASKRGLYVHYPLIVISLIIASFTRSLGFIWLAFLVVLAEFFIVITRFVFSYEQAYMGDLVRFWYAALFLFASAYSLVEGGHVRVDVLYARLKSRSRAWVNALGSLFLGLPVCWSILYYGLGTKQSSLIAPIISFEVSQSGYGMYVKYLMGAFLIVYAISMTLIFVSYFLSSVSYLYREPDAETPMGGEH